MKRLTSTVALLGAAFVISTAFASIGKTGAPRREVAVVEFTQTVVSLRQGCVIAGNAL